QVGIPNQDIIVCSKLGNALTGTPVPVGTCPPQAMANTAVKVTTNATGQATVTLTATQAGSDTITAVFLSPDILIARFPLLISPDEFVFITPLPPPAPITQVALNTAQLVRVSWKMGGTPVADGSQINFFASRGSFAMPANPCPGAVAGPSTCALTT